MRIKETLLLFLALGLAGCAAEVGEAAAEPYKAAQAQDEAKGAPAADAEKSPVDIAVGIAREIEADPDRAVEILKQAGYTEAAFDDLMYKIAADPEMRKAYNEAMNR